MTLKKGETMDRADFYAEPGSGSVVGTAYWATADDGIRLRVGLWDVEDVSKGSVLLLPGRTDYIEQYARVAQEIGKFGYSTLIIDWRGQGLSDRLAEDPAVGHVNHFSDYQKDVAAMMKAAETLQLPKPWYLIGQSMGGCIALRALLNGLQVSACAFTSPMWDIHLSPAVRIAALPLTWAAQAIGKSQMFAPGYSGQTYVMRRGFDGNTLTNDPDMFQYWVDLAKNLPDRQTGGPSMGWLYQALKETRSLAKMASPSIPCIAFCGSQEEIVGVASIQSRIKHWPNGTFELINNAKHELLLEVPDVRQNVVSKICGLFQAVKQR